MQILIEVLPDFWSLVFRILRDFSRKAHLHFDIAIFMVIMLGVIDLVLITMLILTLLHRVQTQLSEFANKTYVVFIGLVKLNPFHLRSLTDMLNFTLDLLFRLIGSRIVLSFVSLGIVLFHVVVQGLLRLRRRYDAPFGE